jgi:ferredoxin
MVNKNLHISSRGDRCMSCGACVGICPMNCIYLNEWRIEFDEHTCTKCSVCVRACPVGAISIGPEKCDHSLTPPAFFPGR